MASTPLRPVLRYIRKIVDGPSSDLAADSQLLDRFVSHQNEAAFTALVERHGPMVMGICRRILCNSHDAEDAFQATFLVLVRLRLGGELARPLASDHKNVGFIPVGLSVNVKANWRDHGTALLEASVENCDPIKTSDQELQVLTKKLVTIKEVKLGQVEKIILQRSDKKKDQVLLELTVKLANE